MSLTEAKKGNNMNQVIISGRITKDIECRYTPSGMAVAKFNLALDRGKDKDGKDRGADFPTVTVFGRTAENLEKFSGKGLRSEVIGRITTGSYEKDGHTVYTTEVTADRIEFIDWKTKSDEERVLNAKPSDDQTGVPGGFAAIDEEIPF